MLLRVFIALILLSNVAFAGGVSIGEGNGVVVTGPLESNGAVPVNIQDQTSEVVDLYLTYRIATASIASNRAIGDTTFDLDAGHGAVVGNILCLKESGRYNQAMILVVSTNTITIDSPLDFAYTTSAVCYVTEHDFTTASGSLASPVLFSISPPTGTRWDIVRITLYVEGSTAMDDGTFGSATALTNGLVVRSKNGIYKNLFNIKTNGELAQRSYDRDYVSKPPAGTGHSMIVRRTFGGQSKNGVVLRLDGDSGDEMQALVQDNLNGNDHIHIIAQGHVVTD